VTKTKENVSFRRDKGNSPIYQEIIVNGKVDTVTKSFNYAVNKYKSRSCLGTREVLGEEDEVQKNGKLFKKLALGDYSWLTYEEVADRAHDFGRGLRALGQASGSSIAMYAETRAEWMISCLGAFSQNIHVCTGEIFKTEAMFVRLKMTLLVQLGFSAFNSLMQQRR